MYDNYTQRPLIIKCDLMDLSNKKYKSKITFVVLEMSKNEQILKIKHTL